MARKIEEDPKQLLFDFDEKPKQQSKPYDMMHYPLNYVYNITTTSSLNNTTANTYTIVYNGWGY